MGAQLWNIERVVKKGDYLYAVVKNHPKANNYGYVLLHRVIMENHIGRLLDTDEVVHHKNGSKKDNDISNLELITSKEHISRHSKYKGQIIVIMKCPNCGGIFERRMGQSFLIKGGSFSTCSNKCKGSFSRNLQLFGKTQLMKSAISENIVRIVKRYPDNSEETIPLDSVETTRIRSETIKI